MKHLNLFKKKKPAQEKHEKTIEFSYEEFLQDDGTTFTEHLRKLHFLNTEEKCKSIGKLLGLDSKPSSTSVIPHGFEFENKTFYQTLLFQAKKICNDSLSNLKSDYATYSAEVNDFANRIPEFINRETERIRKAREIAEKKINIIFSQNRENLNKKMTEIFGSIRNLKNEIRDIEALLAKDCENKPLMYRRLILGAILGTLAVLEGPMNFKAVLLWRDDIISTLLIACLFSLIIPSSAHVFGSYMKKRARSFRELFWMFCAFSSAVSISLIIGNIRFEYLAENNIEILSAFGYGGINFIIFLIGSWVSFHFGYKNPDMVKSLISHQKELANSTKAYEELQNQQNKIEADEALEIQKIDDLYPNEAKTHVNSKFSTLKNELISKEKKYSAVLTAVQSTEALICSYYEEAIYAFRSSNERWRNTPNPAYWEQPISPLKTCFSSDRLHNTLLVPTGEEIPVAKPNILKVLL